MSAVECAVHELHARIEFGAPRLVILVVQTRVAADLAQLGELGKHLELVFLKLGASRCCTCWAMRSWFAR